MLLLIENITMPWSFATIGAFALSSKICMGAVVLLVYDCKGVLHFKSITG